MSACNTRFLASLRSEVRNDLVSELGDPRASRMRSNSSSCLQRATANEAKCNSRVLGAETFGDFGLAVVLYEVGRDAANGTGWQRRAGSGKCALSWLASCSQV